MEILEQLAPRIFLLLFMLKTKRKSKATAINLEPAKPLPATPIPVKPVAPKTCKISLEFIRPEAKAVFVAGSFNGWVPEKAPLKPAGDGRWVGALSVDPGRYEYLFVVDGQWLPDPNAKESALNPYGGTNSVLTVSS